MSEEKQQEGLISARDLEAKILAVVTECRMENVVRMSEVQQMMELSRGLRALESVLTQAVVEKMIMPLQGRRIGFLTDKDKDGGYDWKTVRDCAMEAMLRGYRCTGNEFNIIAGQFYAAQSGVERKVREFPGLTGFVMRLGVPRFDDTKNGALVDARAEWLLDGKPQRLDCVLHKYKDSNGEEYNFDDRIPVRVNTGQGADAILGKATRKMFARIYKYLTGVSTPEGEPPIETTGYDATNTGEAPPRQAPTDRQRAADDLVNKHRKTES